MHGKTTIAFAALGLAMVIFSFVIVGCGGFGCTEVACIGGLTLKLEAPDGKSIEQFSGTVAGRVVECPYPEDAGASEYTCYGDDRVQVEMSPAETVSVDLQATAGGEEFTYTGDLHPEWETSYPNGRRCGSGCEGASETVTLNVKN